jgi:Zn-dependent protease with chaperone function
VAHQFEARYYDGRSAAAHRVRASVAERRLAIEGEGVAIEADVATVRVSERLERAPRLLTFADGSYLEVTDHAALDAALRSTGFRDSLVVRWQNHLPMAIAALLAMLVIVWAGYFHGLPLLSSALAPMVPQTLEERVGSEAIQWLDTRLMKPSQLPAAQRERLAARFAQIVPDDGRRYRLEFRASGIGANALALPGGTVVVTDDLVRLTFDDDAVVGVMAHEIGHVAKRHFMRRVISSTITGAAATLIAGDASGLLSAIPATLADLAYSRDMEREADVYAIELLAQHGIPIAPLADLLESMEASHQERAEGDKQQDGPAAKEAPASSSPGWSEYLSPKSAPPRRAPAAEPQALTTA